MPPGVTALPHLPSLMSSSALFVAALAGGDRDLLAPLRALGEVVAGIGQLAAGDVRGQHRHVVLEHDQRLFRQVDLDVGARRFVRRGATVTLPCITSHISGVTLPVTSASGVSITNVSNAQTACLV